MRARHSIAAGGVSFIALLGVAACGGGEDSGGGAASAAPEASDETVDTIVIDDFEFVPPSATAEAGAEITFDNRDTAGHTASADDPGGFDTGDIPAGDSATVTIEEPGEYSYICKFHPFMEGNITAR